MKLSTPLVDNTCTQRDSSNRRRLHSWNSILSCSYDFWSGSSHPNSTWRTASTAYIPVYNQYSLLWSRSISKLTRTRLKWYWRWCWKRRLALTSLIHFPCSWLTWHRWSYPYRNTRTKPFNCSFTFESFFSISLFSCLPRTYFYCLSTRTQLRLIETSSCQLWEEFG